MGGVVNTVAQVATAPLKVIDQKVQEPIVNAVVKATENVPIVSTVTKGIQAGTKIDESVHNTFDKGTSETVADIKSQLPAAAKGGAVVGIAALTAGAGAGAFSAGGAAQGAFIGDSLGKAAFAANPSMFFNAAVGAIGDEGFDFGSFIENLNPDTAPPPRASAPSPGRSVATAKPVSAGAGAVAGEENGSALATAAILSGLAIGGYFVLKGR